MIPPVSVKCSQVQKPESRRRRMLFKILQNNKQHMFERNICWWCFLFSPLKSTNAVYLGLSQRQANPYNPTPSFQEQFLLRKAGTFICCGARKLLRTKSTMAGLVEGCCSQEARPGEPEPTTGHGSEPARPDPRNVSLWRDLDLPQESDFLHKQGQRALWEMSREQMNSLLCRDAGLCLVEARGHTREMWMPPGQRRQPRGLFTPPPRSTLEYLISF